MSVISLKRKKPKCLLVIAFLLLPALAFWGWQSYNRQFAPLDPGDKEYIDVIIPGQSSARQVASILKEENLIYSENAFLVYSQKNGFDKQLKAGHYRFSRSQSLAEIVSDIAEGRVVNISFTIPEGYTVERVGRLLMEENIATSEEWNRAITKDYNFAFLKGIPAGKEDHLEGFLFPDTYFIAEDNSAEDIVRAMLNAFQQVWDKEFAVEAEARGLSVYDTVTIASMIEKEAMREDEREIIAGVIKNRLEKGMLLQIDASVLYCLGGEKDVVNYDDLEVDSPYNTYKYGGLPPGPIACPGKASIKAALNPQEHDYLYYVSKGDGSHHFSKTYREHLWAKGKYID